MTPARRPFAQVIALACALALSSGCSFSLFRGLEKGSEHNLERLERAVEVNPSNVHAWFVVGKARLDQGNDEEARKAFLKALEADPDFVEARMGLAVAAMKDERWDEAAGVYEDIIQRRGNYVPAWEGLAAARLAGLRLSEAQKAAQEALRRDPASYRAHRILGDAAYFEANYQEALEHWEQALEAGAPTTDLGPIVADLRAFLASRQSGEPTVRIDVEDFEAEQAEE